MDNDLFKQRYRNVKRVKTSSWNQRHILLIFRTNISQVVECALMAVAEMGDGQRHTYQEAALSPLRLKPYHPEQHSDSRSPQPSLWY